MNRTHEVQLPRSRSSLISLEAVCHMVGCSTAFLPPVVRPQVQKLNLFELKLIQTKYEFVAVHTQTK
ncbi:hypothetical protein MPTK1_6g01280 [Marchantia polymorpha subsp. ruderalis]|uniref:Uncharacterized protein n=2 Tax=Marchantia polymorpha TaxID=3197 RepID=A0AAF6BMC1_MARPO|nr:hypothetical protein MARPO_0052s0076 [Marchantia polymorpha]BBN13155.1 hypothetical protein Mp_6g01280 [Marchantia polymorpha subsp. ruderalis]|eukprot:PTQ38292.1 hypothetical protein MARPO_0052s0076 [Marchantia polymorpha]